MWVVGLGNPGRRYAGTRHNAGHAVVRRLVDRWQAALVAREPSFHAHRARVATPDRAGGEADVWLLAPMAFMNRSGAALADFEAFSDTRLVPAESLVVCDDVYLPVGHLRLRAGGSTGGHRGLESVEEHLGTQEYARLRVGVGAAAGEDLVDHVLSEFDAAEEEGFRDALAGAEEAVEVWVREGLVAAMNRFNRRVREVDP